MKEPDKFLLGLLLFLGLIALALIHCAGNAPLIEFSPLHSQSSRFENQVRPPRKPGRTKKKCGWDRMFVPSRRV